MFPNRKWMSTAARTATAVALLAGLAACDGGLLDVDDPDNVPAGGELVPGGVEFRLNGMAADFRSMMGFHALTSGLLNDEFVLAGTFPTRLQIDNREPNANNASIDADSWGPLAQARATADVNQILFSQASGDPEFSGVQETLEDGIAFGKIFSGYARVFMSELYCESILGGQEDLPQFGDEVQEAEPEPLNSEDRMAQAADTLAAAIAAAPSDQLEYAARVGHARALMFLASVRGGEQALFDSAAAVVEDVPDDFVFLVDNSSNTIASENDVWQLTWGDNVALRWTVGGGDDATRGFEIFDPGAERANRRQMATAAQSSPGLDEWIDNGLLSTPEAAAGANLDAFNGNSPVRAQFLYAGRNGGSGEAAPIVLASGWEARMYEAEAMLRRGETGPAQSLVNQFMTDPSLNPMLEVQPGLTGPAPSGSLTDESFGGFREVEFTGDLEGDLREMARAYESGLWLTGHRQHVVRRLAVEFDDRLALGLWPSKSGTNAISLPLPLAEVDNNENVPDAECPAGLP